MLKNKGYGLQQESDYKKATRKILKVLDDNKQHRYSALIKETNLSTATLTKHLTELEMQGIVAKFIDDVTGKYPFPVYYRLMQSWSSIDNLEKDASLMLKRANEDFLKEMNPAGFFYYMNSYLNLRLLDLVPKIREVVSFQDKEKPEVDKAKEALIDAVIDLFFSDVAKVFAKDFLDIILKHGKELDVDLLMKELKERIKKQAEIT
jgi:DNA-binding Lrp family transcriptional regulator